MPFSQGTAGRDHNAGTFVTWMAGAGIQPGVAVGQSDEWGWKAVTPIWCYDLHATVLDLMGIDHTRLTFRFNGASAADRRARPCHSRDSGVSRSDGAVWPGVLSAPLRLRASTRRVLIAPLLARRKFDRQSRRGR